MYCSHIYKFSSRFCFVCIAIFCLPFFALGALYSQYKLLLLWWLRSIEAFLFSSNCTQKSQQQHQHHLGTTHIIITNITTKAPAPLTPKTPPPDNNGPPHKTSNKINARQYINSIPAYSSHIALSLRFHTSIYYTLYVQDKPCLSAVYIILGYTRGSCLPCCAMMSLWCGLKLHVDGVKCGERCGWWHQMEKYLHYRTYTHTYVTTDCTRGD